MKKSLALLLAVMMIFTLAACGQTATAPAESAAPAKDIENETAAEELPSIGMANPITEYDSLDEVNARTGMFLTGPAVMGKTDQRYSVIDCGSFNIGQYDFTLNGVEFCLRGSGCFEEDISGIYGENGPIFADGSEYYRGADVQAARWRTVDGQYVLSTTSEVSEELFEGMVEELRTLTVLTEVDYGVYDALLEQVKAGLESNWADTDPETVGVSNIFAYGDHSVMGWTRLDVDGDGIEELILGEQSEWQPKGVVYDMFTISEEGLLQHVLSGWERNRYYICEGGGILNEGSSGAADSTRATYGFVNGQLLDAGTDPDEVVPMDLQLTMFLG